MAREYTHTLTITGEGVPQTVELLPGTYRIGRETAADIFLDHNRVSRRHAELHCTETICELTDVGSANGTYVQNEKLEIQVPRLLQPGDTIAINPFQLVYNRVAAVADEPIFLQPAEPAMDAVPVLVPPAVLEKTPIMEDIRASQEPAAAEPAAGQLREPSAPVVTEHRLGPQPHVALPGLSLSESRYMRFLPAIYDTEFMNCFLALFESILTPIEWSVDNFDLFLSAATTRADFLPWLASWFGLLFDGSWSEEQRRTLLAEAHWIYGSRGTKRSLLRILEIYLQQPVRIEDAAEEPLPAQGREDRPEPFFFTIHIPLAEEQVNRLLVEQLVNVHKPAHTLYTLSFAD